MFQQSRRPRTHPRTLTLALVCTLCIMGLASHAQAQDQQLFLSLVDQQGTPITDLAPEDLAIVEDGEERETVRLDPIDWPMKLTILVENGVEISQSIIQLRQGLTGLFNALSEGVEASLLTLNPQPRFLVRPTTDHQALIDGLSLIAPDGSPGKFVEGMLEAVDRFKDEDGDFFPVIMAITTDGAEGSSFNESDITKLQQAIADNKVTVHQLNQLLAASEADVRGVQTQLGLGLTKMTTGRYESIQISSTDRLTKLLPEFGQLLGASHRRQSNQYRVTYRRPRGASPPTQGIALKTSREGVRGSLSLDGRVPQP